VREGKGNKQDNNNNDSECDGGPLRREGMKRKQQQQRQRQTTADIHTKKPLQNNRYRATSETHTQSESEIAL
jgi:hypothetical protein